MHLSFYIDYRSTAYCEMFMSKKLKWNPKSDHCTRFYMNGVWFAICDHDENVDREKLGPHWHRGASLKHPGRFYTTNVRVVTRSCSEIAESCERGASQGASLGGSLLGAQTCYSA